MNFNWRKHAFILSLSSVALISACSGGYELEMADGSEIGATDDQPLDSANDEYVVDDNGTVIGSTWQELSYAYCMYPFSDPDGDGWGFEFGRSCMVYKPPAATSYPTCTTPFADPDGDGWGYEYYRTCVMPKPSTGTGGTGGTGGSGGSTGGTGGTAGTGGSTGGTGGGSTATCPNQEGTASTMAALAVSAAMKLGRWQPTKDFAIGKSGSDEVLVLSATGKARCIDGCANTQALLDFQKNEAAGKIKFPGNVTLVPVALRSRLVAKFRDQVGCEMQPSNGGTTNCPVEEHTLTFQRSEKGGCDTNYFFVARKPDGSPLAYPSQLKNKLLWADRVNPYIGFQSVGEVVSIDPTFGLNERGSTTTGACTAACVKIGLTNVAGSCCSCNGESKTFTKAPWSSFTYLCI